MIPERLEFLASPKLPPAQLSDVFAAAGEEIHLVGGSVRDALLGRDVTDFDFATSARPDRVLELLRPWADAVYEVGVRFGTVGAQKDGTTVEVTTYRSEIYRDDSRKPQVTYSDDLSEDLSRRDFTVNAIALSLPGMEAVDPFGGLADLARETLRTPLDPHISFGDDPLRMLRLFRFQATLGFSPNEAALAAVREMGDRLQIVSAERIRDELSKLIVALEPGEALHAIVESGLADHFLPELPGLAMEQDPQHHHKDVLAHTFAVVDKASPLLTLRLAALFHDVGKPETREFGPGGVTFHHHEVVGARMARKRLKELRYPKDVVDDVSQLVYLHLRPHTLKLGWTDSAVRRYVRDAGPLLDQLNELVRCDVTTANQRRERAIQSRIDELEVRIADLSQREQLARLRAPIDGHEVMSYLGIDPGPRVGEIMGILLEKRIEDGPYPRAEAFETARAWALSQGLADPGEPPSSEEE
ncbi:MAG TPA: CCA tRNA nucleotidyltransferase [Acidimicrobiia bacterium]|nr:CCA tRNA nucleotidyltransferase [Acidimicrobiia bacterium]